MRIGAKNAIDFYNLQKMSSSPSDSQREKERLEKQIRRTRETLTGESRSDGDSFASILKRESNSRTH